MSACENGALPGARLNKPYSVHSLNLTGCRSDCYSRIRPDRERVGGTNGDFDFPAWNWTTSTRRTRFCLGLQDLRRNPSSNRNRTPNLSLESPYRRLSPGNSVPQFRIKRKMRKQRQQWPKPKPPRLRFRLLMAM